MVVCVVRYEGLFIQIYGPEKIVSGAEYEHPLPRQ